MGFDLGCLKAVHFYITSDDLLSDCLNQLEASADLAVFWAVALRPLRRGKPQQLAVSDSLCQGLTWLSSDLFPLCSMAARS